MERRRRKKGGGAKKEIARVEDSGENTIFSPGDKHIQPRRLPFYAGPRCVLCYISTFSLSLPPSCDRIILFRASPALSSSFCFFAIFTALSGYYTRRTRECLFERYIHSFPSARSFNFLRFSRPISFLSQPRQVEKGEEIGKQTLLTRFQLCKRESLLFYCPADQHFRYICARVLFAAAYAQFRASLYRKE